MLLSSSCSIELCIFMQIGPYKFFCHSHETLIQNSKDWVRMNESIKLSGKPAIVEGTMCLDQFLGISPRLFNGNFKCFWVEVEKAVAEERRLGIFQRCWNSQREFLCIKLLMLIRL